MTSTTADHNVSRCHQASEDRRQLLCKLKCLAERLDDCDRAAMKASGCGDLFGSGGGSKGSRYVFPDPACTPLITHPEWAAEKAERDNYKMKMPKPPAHEPKLIAGYFAKGCDCIRRNGLQDKCELPQCQGRPLCLTTPVPLCPPSGGADLLVTPGEAQAIIGMIDEGRCCPLSCCSGTLENC